jgi:hypothetical protein
MTIQSDVKEATDTLDRRWGVGEAMGLIDDALAVKVRRQTEKWTTANLAGDPAQIEAHGQAMLKAIAAVDRACVATYGEPSEAPDESPQVAVVRLRDDTVIHIVTDGMEADRLARTGALAFTFEELAFCASAAPGWPALVETKRLFGSLGNAVVRARADRKFFENGGDEIPF